MNMQLLAILKIFISEILKVMFDDEAVYWEIVGKNAFLSRYFNAQSKWSD